MPGIEELLVILLIVLVIFGGAKLPQLARSLGKARGEFHKGLKETEEEPSSSRKAEDSSAA